MAFLARAATHGLEHPPVRIDTHAASVFLAGTNAYKVKRAVRYPYLDFSTLERRKAACDAEIRLNRPNAPAIYRGTIPIVRRADGLHLSGEGQIVEWAVHMRRFDPADTLDKVAERGELSPGLLAGLVNTVVAAHAAAPVHPGEEATARLGGVIVDNVSELASAGMFDAGAVAQLAATWEAALAKARPVLLERGRIGQVRRCHGDLHLGNIVLIDGTPCLFDALEFDESLATTDQLYDLAFLLMDLWQRGFSDAANTVLNRYLWARDEDSDLAACQALPLFMSLRAAIRAKVAVARLRAGSACREAGIAEAERYFATALACMRPAERRLVAVGGLSGSGKTTFAAHLAPFIGAVPGAIHLRSDIERKRMFRVADTERLPQQAYADDITAEVYDRLCRKAACVLGGGQSAMVDAVHDRQSERAAIEAVAREAGAIFDGIWLEADEPVLLRRVASRRGDASDADETVVRSQLARHRSVEGWNRVTSAGSIEEVVDAGLQALKKSPGRY